MEFVLLSLIVLFVGSILVIGVAVIREFYLQKQIKAAQNEMVEFRNSVSKHMAELKDEIEPLKVFILKAHTDLDTIVKEYEINGVPLGYDRGKKADFVEGI